MGLFQDIHSQADQRGLDFLVIGGLAVIFHGFTRDTADLDLLIPQSARARWLELLASFNYTVLRDANSFLQLDPPKAGVWPVDLMVVNETTFTPMMAASLEVEMYEVAMKIPSLDHLLALKLHALKHGHLERYMKDFLDVTGLIGVNKLDLRSERMVQLFQRYGNVALYEKISHACANQE